MQSVGVLATVVLPHNKPISIQFRQLSDLVRCYHLYRFTDVRSGRMEVFPLWRGGVVDDFE